MIVYIKNVSGEIYASPVFAQFGKGWNIKSVVLNRENNALILLPYLKRGILNCTNNYFYIDEAIEEGWQERKRLSGFTEIVENKALIKALKKGRSVALDGLDIIKNYKLPLPVVYNFEIKTEHDISVFETTCMGLHDAFIEEINQTENDIIINFNTTWDKHIVITFYGVKEANKIDDIGVIIDSTFALENDCVTWKALDVFDLRWNELKEEQIFITAQRVTWELKFD